METDLIDEKHERREEQMETESGTGKKEKSDGHRPCNQSTRDN